jgi:putative DNA primase/helicase
MSGDEDDFAARVGAGEPGSGTGDWGDDDEAPGFSDEDLALRFAALYVYTIRHVAMWGRWLKWTGKVWAKDEKKIAFSLSRQICRAAARECSPKAAASIASAKKVAAVEKLAQADPRLATTVDIWDADPWLLNTPDGVVDLRTGKLRAHSSGDYMTQITAVSPGVDCPRFKQFLLEVMAGDEGMVAFVQRVLGYCLTGDISEGDFLPSWHGPERQGRADIHDRVDPEGLLQISRRRGFHPNP